MFVGVVNDYNTVPLWAKESYILSGRGIIFGLGLIPLVFCSSVVRLGLRS